MPHTPTTLFLGMLLFPLFLTAQPSYPAPPDSANWRERITEAEANYWNITEAADLYYNQYPDHSDAKEYSRWKQFWETRVNQDTTAESFTDAFEAWALLGECDNYPCEEDSYEASWHSLGPYNTGQNNNVYVGRIQTVMTDPHDPEKEVVYTGAATSGLYRTNDIYAANPVGSV